MLVPDAQNLSIKSDENETEPKKIEDEPVILQNGEGETKLPGGDRFGYFYDMDKFDIRGSEIQCHGQNSQVGHEQSNEMLLNTQTKWCYSTLAGRLADESLLAWVHIDFKKTLPLKGFGIVSANDCPERDPKNFRLFAKLKNVNPNHSNADDASEYEQKLVEGFTLLKTVENEDFADRFESKRYAFESDQVYEV